ncbi:MAG: LysM peptidoglycan-binding domain-containing protein [Phycisphaerae bacterium]
MRNDVKIGIAVGLVFALGVVLYFVFAGGGEQTPPADNDDNVAQVEQQDDPYLNDDSVNVPVEDESPVAEIDEPTDEPDVEPIEPVEPEDDLVVPDVEPIEPVDEEDTDVVETDPGAGVVEPLIPEVEPIAPIPDEEPEDTAVVPEPIDGGDETPLPDTDRTYTVKEGDAGFWQISQNVYGDGKHWTLLAQANPDVNTNRLRPGQKLKIPPLPTRRTGGGTGATETPTDRGTVQADVTGQEFYVVKKGDSGFWAVAEKVWGSGGGAYWEQIAKANPNLDPTALQPGDKVQIPAKPNALTGEGTSDTTETASTVTAPEGGNVYTVKGGDNFWVIAENAYGNGVYWPVIADANPSVNPKRLRQGQKLALPKLTESMRQEYARGGRTTSGGGTDTTETTGVQPEEYDPEVPYFD